MEYITATDEMAEAIYHIIHTTVQAVYPKYYPKEVAAFFCSHHSKEHILDGIASGHMGVWLLSRKPYYGLIRTANLPKAGIWLLYYGVFGGGDCKEIPVCRFRCVPPGCLPV